MNKFIIYNIIIFITFACIYYVYLKHYEEKNITLNDLFYYTTTTHIPMIDNDIDISYGFGKFLKNCHNLCVYYIFYVI